MVLDRLREIYTRLTVDGSTEAQTVQSGIWVAGINIGDRSLQLLKVILLARLLSPEAFGLLGIALLSIAALRQFSRLGFDEALIQHEEDNVDVYLNTAWVMKIIRGAVIAIIAFLSAPYLAVFFGEAKAEPLIRIIGFSPLILGLQNPAIMYFQKSLNFHREFAYQVGGRFIDLIVAVVIALAFGSVWALPIGIIMMNLTKFVLSYQIHEYRPHIDFNLKYGKEMFGFGKWMFASAILVFLYSQGDDAFIGWFFGATTLGFYQIAYRLSNAPATEVTHVISRVAFPAFSKVQNNVERLRNGYLRAVQLSAIIGFPMATGIIAVAPQFVLAVLGNQWEPMIPLIQILAIWGAIRGFGANVGAVFKAVGRPDYEAKLQAIKVLTIALLIFPIADQFGVLGVAALIVGSDIIIQPISLYLVLSITEANVKQLIAVVAYPLLNSIGMAIVVIKVNRYLFTKTGVIQLSIMIVCGVLCYFCSMWFIEKQTSYEFIELYHRMRVALS